MTTPPSAASETATNSASEPATQIKPTARTSWTLPRSAKWALLLMILGTGIWFFGQPAWEELRDYQESLRSAEDTVPIGYLGINYRRSYHDKPAQFIKLDGDKKLLWAAKKEDDQPEYYDVTDSDLPVERFSGGYGRDSIPGIDAPIFESENSERWSRLRARQEFHGLVTADGPRGYPTELLRKIEVVNDHDKEGRFAIVYDRSRKQARFYESSLNGKPVTFGTTGYSYGLTDAPDVGQPVLYDRSTKSLWIPEDEFLVCVSGKAKGTKLKQARKADETTWSSWLKNHPGSPVLMGGDRNVPIPAE